MRDRRSFTPEESNTMIILPEKSFITFHFQILIAHCEKGRGKSFYFNSWKLLTAVRIANKICSLVRVIWFWDRMEYIIE